MIKAERKNKGTSVSIEIANPNRDEVLGLLILMEELSAVIQAVRERISEYVGEDDADILITTSGKLAYADSEEEIEAIMEETCKALEATHDDDEIQIVKMG